MSAVELDHDRIQRLLAAAAERLDGDWLLVGGALVAVWLESRRVTEDVDLIGLGGTAAERLALMELAEAVGLPIEAVNSAADFFVFRVAGWREEIRLLQSGARGRIHRPTPTLFLLLKMGRLTEQDLDDCILLLRRVAIDGSLEVDRPRVLDVLAKLPETPDAALTERRATLRRAFSDTG